MRVLSAELVELSVRLWPGLLIHLWQTTLFVLAVLPLLLLLRRAPARIRYSVYLIASLKFLLPAALIGVPLARLSGGLGESLAWLRLPVLDANALLVWLRSLFAAGGTGPSGVENGPRLLYLTLSAIWLAGFASIALSWWRRQRRFARLIATGRRIESGREVELLNRVRERLGVRVPVTLVMLDDVAETGVWRVFRPVLVLPTKMPALLSESEFESLLAHEMAHVRRWDNLVANLHMALCCLFWFHPFVWLLDRRLLAEREKACDERVVELLGRADTYARGLVKAVRFGLGLRLAGLSSASSCDLRKRIERIRSGRLERRSSRLYRLGVPAVAALLVAFSVGAGMAGPTLDSTRPELAPRFEPDRCAKDRAPREPRLAIPETAPDFGDCLGWSRGEAAAS